MNVGNGFLAKTCENLHVGAVWQVLADREQRKPVLAEQPTDPHMQNPLLGVLPFVLVQSGAVRQRQGEFVEHGGDSKTKTAEPRTAVFATTGNGALKVITISVCCNAISGNAIPGFLQNQNCSGI